MEKSRKRGGEKEEQNLAKEKTLQTEPASRQREEERGGDHQLHAPHQLEDKTQVHPRPLREAAEGMGISSS